MNNDNFLIEESDLEQARSIVRTISNPKLRNRAVANALAAALISKYFVDAEVDTESGLYHIVQILEELDISDVYIRESYIDVRFYFNDNELYVPKSHFDRNILPVAYMFVKLEEDVAGGLVTGFVPATSVNTTNEVNGYYKVKEDELVSFYDIDSMIVQDYDVEIPDSFETELFDFLDNKLKDRDSFYRLLLTSSEARNRLIDAAKAKNIFKLISLDGTSAVSESADTTSEDNGLELSENNEELMLEPSSDFVLEEADSLEETPVEDLGLASEEDSFSLVEEQVDNSDSSIGELELSTDDTLESFDNDLTSDLSDSDGLIEFETEELVPDDGLALEEFDSDLSLTESDSLLEETSDAMLESSDSDDLPTFDVGPVDLNTDETSASDDNNAVEEELADEGSLNLVIPDADSISMLGVGEIESPKPEVLVETPVEEPVVSDVAESAEQEDDSIVDLASFVDTVDEIDEGEDQVAISAEEAVNAEEDTVQPLDLVAEDVPEESTEEDFEYPTSVSPSINTEDTEEVDINDLENMLENDSAESAVSQTPVQTEAAEQIDDLFAQEDIQAVEEPLAKPQKKGSPLVPLLGLIILGVGGYFGYTKYFAQPAETLNNEIAPAKTVEVTNKVPAKQPVQKPVQKKETPVAMPVETIENVKNINNANEGNAVSIPAIESNLDASVLVSNLSVNWEVPAGIVSNSSAKRYFTKIGKIIQLNLKTELLLLSKPPISNKITLELEFNKDAEKFVVKSMLESSGEKTVDDIIKTTVTKALDMKLSTNMAVFSNVSGNPVLVIRL